jgi:hypothetical protein
MTPVLIRELPKNLLHQLQNEFEILEINDNVEFLLVTKTEIEQIKIIKKEKSHLDDLNTLLSPTNGN